MKESASGVFKPMTTGMWMVTSRLISRLVKVLFGQVTVGMILFVCVAFWYVEQLSEPR